MVNRGTITSKFKICTDWSKWIKCQNGPSCQKQQSVYNYVRGGLTEGSLGTSTTCYGTRYHAKNISLYHYTVFLGGTKISTDHFFTSFREILGEILKIMLSHQLQPVLEGLGLLLLQIVI